MNQLTAYVAEVSYENRIDEYTVAADDAVQARDLVVLYLSGNDGWKSIRVRDTPESAFSPARVLRK